jgi:hypothetical protein
MTHWEERMDRLRVKRIAAGRPVVGKGEHRPVNHARENFDYAQDVARHPFRFWPERPAGLDKLPDPLRSWALLRYRERPDREPRDVVSTRPRHSVGERRRAIARHAAGESYRRIAVDLGVSVGTLKSWCSRGL